MVMTVRVVKIRRKDKRSMKEVVIEQEQMASCMA